MIDLKSIIDSLTIEESKNFVSFLNQKNKRNDTKNIELFKLLKNENTDTKSICNKLYKNDNRNAYHALRNRLLHSLIDFTANKNLEQENSIEMQIIKYILASRTFLLQKKYTIAYKILDKAEDLANTHLLYSILNEIYHTKIQYASENARVNLELLIKKQKENQEKHKLEDQLNVVYAKLKSTLKSISYKAEIIDFESILSESLKNTGIVLNDSLSFKSLYQILQIANISAFIETNYFQIEDFVLKSYHILKQKKETNKQLYYQIEIVYIIGNTLFRNRKFKDSLKFTKEMEQLMLLNKKQYYKRFILKKVLVESLNLNYLNKPEKAIRTIEDILKRKHNDLESVLDLKLTLIMFYFQQDEINKSKAILAKLYHTDNWYTEKAGIDWTIKKNIIEILLYVELQEENLFQSRLKSFKKRYKNYLTEKHQIKILEFLKFVENYYNKPETFKTAKLEAKITRTFSSTNIKNEDIFDISFYAWLYSKLKNTPIYETTLHILKK